LPIGCDHFTSQTRGSLHGPGFNQVELVLAKHFPFGATTRNAEFRIEVFNVFDRANFSNPVAMPNALLTNATTKANKVQPAEGRALFLHTRKLRPAWTYRISGLRHRFQKVKERQASAVTALRIDVEVHRRHLFARM
jgi:hypothetical protein